MPERATQTIRTRVTETCLQNLAGDAVTEEARQELREHFEEAKPPKADAFVALFEKYSEGMPA